MSNKTYTVFSALEITPHAMSNRVPKAVLNLYIYVDKLNSLGKKETRNSVIFLFCHRFVK